MKKVSVFFLILILTLSNCQRPIDQIQGVFIVSKDSLKASANKQIEDKKVLTSALLNTIIENSIIEFKIRGDSVIGLIFLAGSSTIIDGTIQLINDTLKITSTNMTGQIIPNSQGFIFRNLSSGVEIQMNQSGNDDLSEETKTAIANVKFQQQAEQEFKDNLGKWQKGNFVDEFGDQTTNGFAYCIISGSHETSSVVDDKVLVKAIIDDGSIYFEIFNSTMTFRETFPSNEAGLAKIKMPDGEVTSERILFRDNIIFESTNYQKALIYNYLIDHDGELKVLIDLSTASSYYSDKYQFSISRSNLPELLPEIN